MSGKRAPRKLVVLTESSTRCIMGMEQLCRELTVSADELADSGASEVRWVRYHDDEYSQPDSIVTVLDALVAASAPAAKLLLAFPFISTNQADRIRAALRTLKANECEIYWCGATAAKPGTTSPQSLCSQLGIEFREMAAYRAERISPVMKGFWEKMDDSHKRAAWIEYRMRQLYMRQDQPGAILRDTLSELLRTTSADLTLPPVPDAANKIQGRHPAKTTQALLARYSAKGYPAIAGRTQVIEELKKTIACLARTEQNVLIIGETGTGKEMAAYFLHELGLKRDKPYLELNCAGIDDDQAESMLFGHVKGAFTGAIETRKGLVDEAAGGTLFLDELPELSGRLQAKLLRFIQSGEYYTMGSSVKKTATCRIVAGGQLDRIKEHIRSDLYHRLAESVIHMPALRELPDHDKIIIARNRADDLQGKIRSFWDDNENRPQHRPITQGDIDKFWDEIEHNKQLISSYCWPGNVRELYGVVKRSLTQAIPLKTMLDELLAQQSAVSALAEPAGIVPEIRSADDLITLAELQHRYVTRAATLGLSQKELAQRLGCAINTLKEKLRPAGVVAEPELRPAPAGQPSPRSLRNR